MHLVTAAVLTALFRKRAAGHEGLPSFAGVMETVHVLPGRLRLRAPALIGRRAAAEQLKKSLARLEGVRDVEVSSVSGSVLFRFAPDEVTPDLLLGAAIRLLGLEKDIERTPPSQIGEGIRNAGQSLNHAIYQQTDGVIDLWTSITLLLVVSGIRQLAAGNPFGWPLLWWAYRSTFSPKRARA
jgi:Heavy metal associated domain 2